MDKYINYLSEYFRQQIYNDYYAKFQGALARYFGIAGQGTTNAALKDYADAFLTGTAINTWELQDIGNGELRIVQRFEITIKADYVGLVPVLAQDLGYREPVEVLPNEGE